MERAGTFDTDKVRGALQTFKDEPLLAGPTTFTADSHINMQRDLLLIEVKDGKSGNVIQVVARGEDAAIVRGIVEVTSGRGPRMTMHGGEQGEIATARRWRSPTSS